METQAGAQESLVYLAIKFNSSRRGGFPPSLGGDGGFVATVPIFDADDWAA
jgi:hypothetical protein